ncbi:hypothetical protein ACFLSQ_06710 [Bacteroidota bacterium]
MDIKEIIEPTVRWFLGFIFIIVSLITYKKFFLKGSSIFVDAAKMNLKFRTWKIGLGYFGWLIVCMFFYFWVYYLIFFILW